MVGPIPFTQTDGEEFRLKEIMLSSVEKLSGSSSLAVCREGEAMINTSLYPNL